MLRVLRDRYCRDADRNHWAGVVAGEIGQGLRDMSSVVTRVLEMIRSGFVRLRWRLVWLFDFSGMRVVWLKFFPRHDCIELEEKGWKPRTGVLWAVSIYSATFGIASNRYENALDRIEHRQDSIYAQLGTEQWKAALARIPGAQKMTRPKDLEFFWPSTVFVSMFGTFETDRENIETLKDIAVSFKKSLRDVYFYGADLSGADLTGADFTGAQLSWAHLSGTRLWRANFTGAFLTGAYLVKADPIGANFTNAHLAHSKLTNANFKDAILAGADLGRATLVKADLTGADLTGADLTGAYLTRADLTGADLTGADLTDADLTNAGLIGTVLIGADLTGADLTNAYLTDAILTGADLTATDLTGVKALSCEQLSESENFEFAYRDESLACGHAIRDDLRGEELVAAYDWRRVTVTDIGGRKNGYVPPAVYSSRAPE